MIKFNVEKIAVLLGAMFLFVVSPYVSSVFPFIPHINAPSHIANIIFPGNVLLLLLPLIFWYGSFFFLPSCFIILSIFFRRKNYINFFTMLVSMLMVLDIVWILHSWQGGIRYQKPHFTIGVAIENGLCFFIIYLTIAAYYKWRKCAFLYFSALILCLTLTFFAFPWLGEPI